MSKGRAKRARLAFVGIVAAAFLCAAVVLWLWPWSDPQFVVSPGEAQEIESYLNNSGGKQLDYPLTFTPARTSDHSEFSHSLPVFWLTQDNPKLPLTIHLQAVQETESQTTESLSAELREREIVFSQPPRGLFVFEDPKSQVIFPLHAVRSDGNGRVVAGARKGASDGIPCAAAARIEIRVTSRNATPKAAASTPISWIADPGQRDIPSWSGEVIVPLANANNITLILPRFETMFVVTPEVGFAFEWQANGVRRSGFGYSHGMPHDGEVIDLHLIQCGFLVARVRERNPSDFINELDRQFEGWFASPRYPLHVRIRSDTDSIEASTPGAGFEIDCDRPRAERIGSGAEEIRIPFLPAEDARNVHVTVSASQIVASTYVTILPGEFEKAVWLDAISLAWKIQVIAENAAGDPVEDVGVELTPTVWIRPKSALSIGPGRSQSTDKLGIARFEGLPFMPGLFMTLRIESPHTILEAPYIIQAPEEPTETVVHIRLDDTGAQDWLWVRLEIPEGTEGASNWMQGQIRYAIVAREANGGLLTWDDGVSLSGKNTFAVKDAPPGEYTVVVTGPFGVSTGRGQVTATERTLVVTLAPRALNGVLLRDGKPLAGAVIFPLALEPSLVRMLGESGAHGMISLGQRATDSQGRFSILHSGETPPEEWGYFHKDVGAFTVSPGDVAADGRQVLHFESSVPVGKLILSFTPSDDGTLASSVHITPIISEDEKRTVLDFAWGMALTVPGSELVIDKLPAGRYMILVTGKSGGGGDQITVAPEWKQIAVIEADRTTSLTFPYTD